MPGLLVELAISWLLLWFFYKKSVLALGIAPTPGRLLNLIVAILIAGICATLYYLSFSTLINNEWIINKEFTAQKLVSGSWWTLQSVLYEELIFRGALLYILIRKLGVRVACIISAISFGVYHWFTSGALGDPLGMTVVFFMTGIWGWMFAIAFAKTKSLYLPIGLHFGWNCINTVIFSQGPLGKHLLMLNGDEKMSIALNIVVLIFQLFAVPVIVWFYLRWLSKKQELIREVKPTTATIGTVH